LVEIQLSISSTRGCFLIQRGKEFTGLEVKAKETLSPRDLKGLQTVAELEAVRRRIVIFLGQRPFQTEDGIEVLPVQDFLGEIEAQRI
jgi:predicted AAA+ superfamily ATPase